jgi:hypothetical protein
MSMKFIQIANSSTKRPILITIRATVIILREKSKSSPYQRDYYTRTLTYVDILLLCRVSLFSSLHSSHVEKNIYFKLGMSKS